VPNGRNFRGAGPDSVLVGVRRGSEFHTQGAEQWKARFATPTENLKTFKTDWYQEVRDGIRTNTPSLTSLVQKIKRERLWAAGCGEYFKFLSLAAEQQKGQLACK